MAEELTTPEVTAEVEVNPTAEIEAKLALIESKVNEKDSKIEELTESLDKMRNRVKRGKKKAKELIQSGDEPEETPEVDTSEFKETDLAYELRSFKEEVQFTRDNPEYKGDDIKQVKLISKEKGLSLDDAKIFYDYEKRNDPSAIAQQKSNQSQLHGQFHKPSTQPQGNSINDLVMKGLGSK